MAIGGPTWPTLFKGAGPGTQWHKNDARLSGFTAAATKAPSRNAVISHIIAYSFPSPYISVSTSFAVARQYALAGPGGAASQASPGYVYEIDLSQVQNACIVTNPIRVLSTPTVVGHHHDGDQSLITTVAQGATGIPAPVPHSGGTQLAPNISADLRALVYAIRDAELFVSQVPKNCVVHRHDVY